MERSVSDSPASGADIGYARVPKELHVPWWISTGMILSFSSSVGAPSTCRRIATTPAISLHVAVPLIPEFPTLWMGTVKPGAEAGMVGYWTVGRLIWSVGEAELPGVDRGPALCDQMMKPA